MNKLMGFFELKQSALPTIPWKEYTGTQKFSEDRLWTIRTAVYSGKDLNLPRHIGVKGREADQYARELYEKFQANGMVVYYPFFIAEKSGTLHVYPDKTIVEAVKDDLWNLVTHSDREVTIIKQKDGLQILGNRNFLSIEEQNEIFQYVPKVKSIFRDYLIGGTGVLLEWSFAYDSDGNGNRLGEKYFVFYEARTV